MTFDVVVIGAGIDGLVAAHCLARVGRRVLVLDRYTEPDPWADVGWVPPRVARDLAVARHGLRVVHADPWLTVPLPAGGRLELWRDVGKTADAIRRVNPGDAARWPAFCERMARLAHLLESLYTAPAPDPMERGIGGLARLSRIAWRVRRLGRRGMVDLLRVLPMSVHDLLDDWFETDVLKGAIAAGSVRNLRQGPRAGGTAFSLLHHHAGSPPGVFRAARSNLPAVLASMPGVEVRRGPEAETSQISMENGRASGVVLADGKEIDAPIVLSAAAPVRTLLELLDPGWLDPELVRAVRHIRSRGVTARVALRLNRDPAFGTLAIAPSLAYLERAYDAAKYGRVSEQPYLEARCDAGSDGGAYEVDVCVQYAPHSLADGAWDDARRDRLGDLCVEMLADHVPDLRDTVVGRTVLAPPDLEARFGWPEGQPYHAELALDQALFMRPTPQLATYRAPVPGLYLCGPAMHPGGGIAGATGANAAKVVLRDGITG